MSKIEKDPSEATPGNGDVRTINRVEFVTKILGYILADSPQKVHTLPPHIIGPFKTALFQAVEAIDPDYRGSQKSLDANFNIMLEQLERNNTLLQVANWLLELPEEKCIQVGEFTYVSLQWLMQKIRDMFQDPPASVGSLAADRDAGLPGEVQKLLSRYTGDAYTVADVQDILAVFYAIYKRMENGNSALDPGR